MPEALFYSSGASFWKVRSLNIREQMNQNKQRISVCTPSGEALAIILPAVPSKRWLEWQIFVMSERYGGDIGVQFLNQFIRWQLLDYAS